MLTDVKEIKDKAILDVKTTLVKEAAVKGKVTGSGTAGLAVAHYGSNNMIAFRYALRNVPMKIADKSFTADGVEFPAGSFVIAPPADLAAVRAAVEKFGLTAASLTALPSAAMHDADLPRIAMYSSWTGTQEIGWVRFTFDKFGIPYDLIYKERVKKGNLRNDYDVILMPTQQANRQAVYQAPAARPVPYMKDAKYKFLGMYGETADITGGMGGEGVDAFAKFLDGGGTLIAMGNAVRFPTELGFARTVDASGNTSSDFYAPRPLVNAEVLKLDHPVFYGYTEKIMPIKYLGGPLMTVGAPDQAGVLARYVGGDEAVLSGLMKGAAEIRQRPFAVDVPGGFTGKGRVVLFANNPIYRWQNHGEFNMVFNAVHELERPGCLAPPSQPRRRQRPANDSSGRAYAERTACPPSSAARSRTCSSASPLQHYVADYGLAVSVFLALRLGRPLFLEGEAGVGKTALASAVAAALETDLIRLQCYEGLDVTHAVYEWDYARQLVELRILEASGELDRTSARRELYSDAFLIKRPLLQAIDPARTRPAVLLIDEIDRADEEFEGYLLELLAEFQITIPELGTVRAAEPPLVILTSNRTREVHDALKRRCLYQWIEYPAFDKELAIVQGRVPHASARLAAQVTALVQELRTRELYKVPGVSETLDWVAALAALDARTLDPALVDATLGVALKSKEDIDAVRGETLATLVARAASQ